MKKAARRRALGSDVFAASHPVDLYAVPANERRRGKAQHDSRHRRPQLNALLESWDDVARFRAVAHLRHADMRDVLKPALELYVKTLTAAERRAIDVEAKRFAAELSKA